MKALVLESIGKLALKDMDIYNEVGEDDVRVEMKRVGICGSDVHFYTHGKIGDMIVKSPIVLGHEGSGLVIEVGKNVRHLKVGDKVCMEPNDTQAFSRAMKMGSYNLDPHVKFWAAPPVHGCLCESVVHKAHLCFKLPENVGYNIGAMVEPLAVGMHACMKAKIKPGDTALVLGAGTIGMVTALAALSSGCSKVIISDIVDEKLNIIGNYDCTTTVNIKKEDLLSVVQRETGNWGADVIFECSGNHASYDGVFSLFAPGAVFVLVGMPLQPVSIDVVQAQSKEIRIESIFRYANVYQRSIDLLGSGKINLAPLETDLYQFEDSVEAFKYAENPKPTSVKVQIEIAK